jgi:hypothetical protein
MTKTAAGGWAHWKGLVSGCKPACQVSNLLFALQFECRLLSGCGDLRLDHVHIQSGHVAQGSTLAHDLLAERDVADFRLLSSKMNRP